MSLVESSYDTEKGNLVIKVDGKRIPNAHGLMINAPPGYDNDLDDDAEQSYGPKVYCQISVFEKSGDLTKRTTYSNANLKEVQYAVECGDARKSKALPAFIIWKNDKKISDYLQV